MKNCTKLLLYIALILGVLQAENSFSLYQNLPERTLAVVHHTNIPASLEAFQKTFLCQMYQEQEVQEFLNSFIDMARPEIEKNLRQLEAQFGFSLQEIISIFQGDLTIAVVDFDPEQETLGVALSIDFGENGTIVRRLLELAQQMSRITLATSSYQDVSIMTVNEAPSHMKISYAIIENTLVLSSRIELLQEVILGSEKKLIHNPNFISALAKVQPEEATPGKLFFLNMEQATKQFTPFIPEEVQAVVEKLGGFELKSFAMAANTTGQYINWNMFVGCNKNKGLFSLLDFGEASLSSLNNIPKNSVVASVAHIDYDQFIEKVEGIMLELDPQGGIFQEYKKGEEQLTEMLGFSVRNDLLKSLGSNTYSFGYLPEEGGLLPKSITVMALRNKDNFMDVVRKSCAKINLDLKEMYVEGTTVNYFSAPLGNLGDDPFQGKGELEVIIATLNMSLSGIAFFIENDELYFAANMLDVKHYLANRQHWTSINENPDFLAMKNTIPQGCSSFIYTDWRGIFNGIWNTIVPLLRSGDGLFRGLGVPFDSALLPRAKTISKYLTPGIVCYKTDDDGILLSASGTMELTIPLLGVSVVGVTAAVAIPALLKSKIAGNESAAIANLKNMMTCQTLFQNSCILDRNSNGIGEYGFLQELAGLSNVRGTDMAIEPPFLFPMSFNNGIGEKNGYYFYCYLSGQENAVGEAEAGDDDAANADNQEVSFVIYAWPVKQDQTGSRAFAINSSGQVLNTYYHSYNSWNTPQANAAYEEGSDNNLGGSFASDNYAVDGNYWSPVYDY